MAAWLHGCMHVAPPLLPQWMTERGGGSDVLAGTQTVAEPVDVAQTGVGAWFRWAWAGG